MNEKIIKNKDIIKGDQLYFIKKIINILQCYSDKEKEKI